MLPRSILNNDDDNRTMPADLCLMAGDAQGNNKPEFLSGMSLAGQACPKDPNPGGPCRVTLRKRLAERTAQVNAEAQYATTRLQAIKAFAAHVAPLDPIYVERLLELALEAQVL